MSKSNSQEWNEDQTVSEQQVQNEPLALSDSVKEQVKSLSQMGLGLPSIKQPSVYSKFFSDMSKLSDGLRVSAAPLSRISEGLAEMTHTFRSMPNASEVIERAQKIKDKIATQLEELEQSVGQAEAWIPQVAKKTGQSGWTIHSDLFITDN